MITGSRSLFWLKAFQVLRVMGGILKWTLILGVSLGISAGVFLSSNLGKKALVDLANNKLKTTEYDVKINKLSSFFPLIISVDRILLRDTQGVWLDISGVHLDLDTWRILTDQHVQGTLSGDSISLTALPENEGKTVSKTEDPTQMAFDIPVGLTLKIDFPQVHLGAAVGGQDIDLSLKGIDISYTKETKDFHATLPLTTKSFGAPLTMLLKADGELENFKALFAVKSDLIHYNEVTLQAVSLKGLVTGLPFTPQGRIGLDFIYDKIKGALKIKEITTQDQILTVKDISLKGLSADIQSSASYNFETAAIKARFQGTIGDLSPLSTLGGYPLSGALKFKGDMAMVGKETTANLHLQGSNIKSVDFSMASLKTTLKIAGFLNLPTVLFNLNIEEFNSNGLALNTVTAKSNLKKGIGSLTLQGHGTDLDLEIATDLKLTKEHQHIKVQKLSALYNQQPFRLLEPFDLTLIGDLLQVSPATFNIISFPFAVQGQLQDKNLDFTLKGEANLGILSQLFLYSGDIIQGQLHVDFKVKGTTDKPDLEGIIELTKGGYENVIYGTKFHDLHVKATAKNDLITLTEIKARDGHGGHLLVSGSYHRGRKNLDVKADVVDMRLAYTDTLKVVAQEGHFQATGPLNNVLLSGNLTMGDVSYNIITAFVENVAELNVIDPTKPPKPLEKEHKRSPDDFQMRFDLTVDIPSNIRVYGLGLESLWGGKLKISNTLDDMLITGKIKLEHGQLDFLSQRIDIEEGLLTFDGQEGNIPYLALQAGFKKEDFKAIVALNGRATQPTFALSSEPSVPQSEVLSHLLFGSKSSKLSPLDALKLAKVAAELSGVGGGSGFADLMKNQMSKEDLTVEGAASEKEATFQAKESIADKVHVRIDQGVKLSDSKVVVDVDITDNISVSTEVGTAQSSESVGLNYTFDY